MMADTKPNVVVVPPGAGNTGAEPDAAAEPAKILRIGAMARELLDEIRRANLDEASRDRLRDVYQVTLDQLAGVLSPELREELEELALPLNDGTPTEGELRVAHAQLVGWLEGLFHGIQATIFAQQMETQARLAEIRRRGLPRQSGAEEAPPGGTYL